MIGKIIKNDGPASLVEGDKIPMYQTPDGTYYVIDPETGGAMVVIAGPAMRNKRAKDAET